MFSKLKSNPSFLHLDSTAKILQHIEFSCKETQTDLPTETNPEEKTRPSYEQKITKPLQEQLTNGHDGSGSSTADYRTVFRYYQCRFCVGFLLEQ
jgi:hypothetical protein